MKQVNELLEAGKYEEINVEIHQKISDLLKELGLEGRHFGLLVNGKKADEDTLVYPNDKVVILPHIAGG